MRRPLGVAGLFPLLVLVVSCAATGVPPMAVVSRGTQTAPVTDGQRQYAEHLPWREAGLTERRAAAHLLDRFTFGARPGEVDALLEMGLERWLDGQLARDLPERALTARLEPLTALRLSSREMVATYPNPGQVLKEARDAGVLTRDPRDGEADDATRKERRRKALEYARANGYRPQRELIEQLTAQKLIRAVYAENQLGEVLTDFWLNHFNVSIGKGQCRQWALSYERDAIRPFVLGSFHDLLSATAKHPAMLLYLDNAVSIAPAGATTTAQTSGARNGRERRRGWQPPATREMRPEAAARQAQGLNENYARELMELHTLGVDGGYTQRDVTEVARALTGWTVMPAGPARGRAEERAEQAQRRGLGVVVAGDFLFRPDQHDGGEKTILGRRFPSGRGIEDGEEVLALVAGHAATARHLARELASRFVSDDPPQPLVDRLARVFNATHGDLGQVMRALAYSPEFWSPSAAGAKIKSPFELAVSALRALDADVRNPKPLLGWIARMGEPLYACQPPTGYPDRADFWVSAGSLLNRMNFGMELASQRIGGVRFDLLALNHGREPGSATDALTVYGALLLPGRATSETVQVLAPAVNEPAAARRLAAAAPPTDDPGWAAAEEAELFGGPPVVTQPEPRSTSTAQLPFVVGLVLGSPEFQRR